MLFSFLWPTKLLLIQGEGNFSSTMAENGFSNATSLLNSEKAVQELLQRSPLMETDEHLIEFSEALRSMCITVLFHMFY